MVIKDKCFAALNDYFDVNFSSMETSRSVPTARKLESALWAGEAANQSSVGFFLGAALDLNSVKSNPFLHG